MILLWKLNDSKEPEQTPVFQEDEDAQLNKESWSVFKTLRYTNVQVWYLQLEILKILWCVFRLRPHSKWEIKMVLSLQHFIAASTTQLDLF